MLRIEDIASHADTLQLIRTLAVCRPDLTECRHVTYAYRTALKSLDRCYLELHDEDADLEAMITGLVAELTPELVSRQVMVTNRLLNCLKRYISREVYGTFSVATASSTNLKSRFDI